jgi:hypothetical protein
VAASVASAGMPQAKLANLNRVSNKSDKYVGVILTMAFEGVSDNHTGCEKAAARVFYSTGSVSLSYLSCFAELWHWFDEMSHWMVDCAMRLGYFPLLHHPNCVLCHLTCLCAGCEVDELLKLHTREEDNFIRGRRRTEENQMTYAR